MGTTTEINILDTEELDQLANALNLSTDFSFYLLTCDTPAVADIILSRLESEVSRKRGEPVIFIRLDPYRTWVSLEEPVPRQALVSEILEHIGLPGPEARDRGAIHIIDASRALPMDGDRWKWLFQRMNEQRNTITRNLGRELIVLVPPWLVNSFRKEAEAFFNVRSGDFRVLASPKQDPPGARSHWSWEPMDAARRNVLRVPADVLAQRTEDARRRVADAQTPREQVSALTHLADIATTEAITKVELARVKHDALRRGEAIQLLDEAVEIRREVIRRVSLSADFKTGADKPMLNPDHARGHLATTLTHRGYVLYEDGRLQHTKADGAEARDILLSLLDHPCLEPGEERTAQIPGDPEWWSDLVRALILLGDVELSNLNPECALRTYEASCQVARRLTEQAGGVGAADGSAGTSIGLTEWKRLLSISLDRVGDAHFSRGELDMAMLAYKQALGIVETLLEADPRNLELQADRLVSRDRIGDVHLARGEVEMAAQQVEDAMPSSKQLAGYSLPWKRDHSVAEINIGDVHRAAGRLDEAIQAYLSSLATRRELLRRDPRRPEWARDVAIALQRLGQVHASRGDHGRALLAYTEAITLMQGLVQADRERAAWRLELIFLLERRGSLRLGRGEAKQARADFEEAAELTRGAQGRTGFSPAWREGQLRVLQGLRDALTAVGDHEGLRAVEQALSELTDNPTPTG